MTDYENIIQRPLQGNSLTPAETENYKSQAKLKASDPKTAEVSQKTFSVSSNSTIPTLEEHDIELKHRDVEMFDENEHPSIEKTASVVTPILSGSIEENLNPPVFPKNNISASLGLQEATRSEVYSISEKINDMTEDELIEALENPDFAEHLDEIYDKLDALEEEVREVMYENKTSISNDSQQESELSDIERQEVEISQVIEAEAIEKEQESIVLLENAFVQTNLEDGSILLEKWTENTPKNAEIVFKDPKRPGTFVTSKENMKASQGKKTYIKNDFGDIQLQECSYRPYTEEEEKAFHSLVTAHVHFESLVKEEMDKTEDTVNFEIKFGKSEKLNEKEISNDKQIDGEEINGTQINPDSQSVFQLVMRNLKKISHEIKMKDEKIRKEVLKHEVQVNNIKRMNLIADREKQILRAEAFNAENLKLNAELEKITNEYLESPGIDIPLPLKQKFKEIEISFQKISLVVGSNEFTPELMDEIITFKKEIFSTVKSMLSSSGSLTKVGIGTSGTSR